MQRWDAPVFFDNITASATTTGLTVVDRQDYYAFGLAHNQNPQRQLENKYLYNGKELQDDLNLGVYHYGARMYDPAAPHWWQVDPAADKYESVSPYSYVLNNPIRLIDPDGEDPGDVVVAFGGGNYESERTARVMGEVIHAVNDQFINERGGVAKAFPSRLWEPREPIPGVTYVQPVDGIRATFPPTENVLNELTQEAFDFAVNNYNRDNGEEVEGGRVIITGFSYGGVLGMHLARRLNEAGIPVTDLITLDAAAGPHSDELDRTVPENTVSNTNVFQTQPQFGTRSRGGFNGRSDGSFRGIHNIRVRANHGDIDDEFKEAVIRWILQDLNLNRKEQEE